jgi:diguanylate cyclase (GGDEF)-like protein
VLNIFLGLDIATIYITIGTSITCIIILLYAHRTGTYIKAAYITFTILILVIYPALWLTNAGSKGPTPYFIIFNTILVAILLEKKKMYFLMVLMSVVIIILIFIEINFPHLILSYESSQTQTLDLGISALLVSFFTLIIIQRLMSEYNHRIDELRLVQNQLRKLSITDELTGIYNRRYIIQEISNQLADVNEVPFSIVMFDIDDFKHINDHYSHAIGDEVIKGVGLLLESEVRPIDVVGRIGGEEYLVLLMDTSEKEAYKRAEALRLSISNLKWSIPLLSVTVSGGVYSKGNDETLDYILDQVDHRLYKAKASGKNKII